MGKLLLRGIVFELTSLFTLIAILWLTGDEISTGVKAHGLFFTLPLFALLNELFTEDTSSLTSSSRWMLTGGGVISGFVLFWAFMILSGALFPITGWPWDRGIINMFLIYLLFLGLHIFLFYFFSCFWGFPSKSQTFDDSSSFSDEP